MTTTSSSQRRLHGRKDSSTIPTPRIHSSFETHSKLSNVRRSKKQFGDTNEIILEPQNTNHYQPSYTPPLSLQQSEQIVDQKYKDLLIDFFQRHQPSYIFEPLRKEYYWTDEPFDQEKITRLEKLLHSTSYFIQSIFWYFRIFLAVCITIPIEIIQTILAGLFKPILIRLPIIISDTLIKPFYAALFNTLILPIGILLWNTSELLAKALEPFIRLFTLLFEPCLDCLRSLRHPSSPSMSEPHLANHADGDHHTEKKKSTLYV